MPRSHASACTSGSRFPASCPPLSGQARDERIHFAAIVLFLSGTSMMATKQSIDTPAAIFLAVFVATFIVVAYLGVEAGRAGSLTVVCITVVIEWCVLKGGVLTAYRSLRR
ncbi:hypothetical protein HYV73_03815 [Candidatus Uhrbacteria bacterium]|nr:hypothetical protein [Candidatus Uhrbacteria bacterium]